MSNSTTSGEEVEDRELTDEQLRPIEDEDTQLADDTIPADEEDAAEQEAGDDPIPSDLVALAKSMGYSDSSIARLGTKEALEESIAATDRVMAQFFQQQSQYDDPSATTEIPQEEDDIDFSHIDEDDPARKVLEAMHQKLKSTETVLKQFTQQSEQLQQQQAMQQQQQAQQVFDDALNSLGSALLGENAPSNQVQYQNRAQIWNTTMYLAGLAAQQGQPVDLASIAKRAAYATLGDQLPTETNKAQLAAIKRRSAQRTGAGARAQTETVTDWKDSPAIREANERLIRAMAEQGL